MQLFYLFLLVMMGNLSMVLGNDYIKQDPIDIQDFNGPVQVKPDLKTLIQQQKQLIEKIITNGNLSLNILDFWQQQQLVDFIKQWDGHTKTIGINQLMVLYTKSLRLSVRYNNKIIDNKKLLVNLIGLTNTMVYGFTGSYIPRDQQAEGSKWDKTHTINWDINNGINSLSVLIDTYFSYQKNLWEQYEIENQIFINLTSQINNYMNNKLILTALIVKAIFCHMEIEMMGQQQDNFSWDQIIQKTQKLYKYLDKIFQTLESIDESLYKIKVLTGEDFQGSLVWSLEDKPSDKKSMVLWQGSVVNGENSPSSPLNGPQRIKFFNDILTVYFKHRKDKNKTLFYIHKVFNKIGLDKNNPSANKKKKTINNYISIFLTKIVQGQHSTTYRYDNDKYEKITSSWRLSTGSQPITGAIMDVFIKKYDHYSEGLDQEEKARNICSQYSQWNGSIQSSQYKLEYLNQKIQLYEEKLQQNENKGILLLSKYKEMGDQLKRQLLDLKKLRETNEINKNRLWISFLQCKLRNINK
jgi:hypothetical protein